MDNGDISAEDLQEILNILHDTGGKVNVPVDADND